MSYVGGSVCWLHVVAVGDVPEGSDVGAPSRDALWNRNTWSNDKHLLALDLCAELGLVKETDPPEIHLYLEQVQVYVQVLSALWFLVLKKQKQNSSFQPE